MTRRTRERKLIHNTIVLLWVRQNLCRILLSNYRSYRVYSKFAADLPIGMTWLVRQLTPLSYVNQRQLYLGMQPYSEVRGRDLGAAVNA
jgi:hypothetical protein